MTEPRVSATLLIEFPAFARRHGLDPDRLLAAAGLTAADIADSGGELPLNAVAEVLNAAALQSDDPCFGIHWAEGYPRGGSGVIGYLLMNAATVRDGVTAVARYIRLLMHPIDVAFVESDGIGRLEWRFPATFTASRVQYTSFAMALLIIRIRRHAGAGWNPIGIELEHRAFDQPEEATRVFGPNVRYDCPVNALNIREIILDSGARDADRRLFDLVRQFSDRLLAEQAADTDILTRCRAAIVRELEQGRLTLPEIAAELKLSVRTLQSELAAAGTSYETLLQETRQRMALHYLRDSDLPMTDIAFLLGFSELSAFTRAANRWFGKSPSAYRDQVRQH